MTWDDLEPLLNIFEVVEPLDSLLILSQDLELYQQLNELNFLLKTGDKLKTNFKDGEMTDNDFEYLKITPLNILKDKSEATGRYRKHRDAVLAKLNNLYFDSILQDIPNRSTIYDPTLQKERESVEKLVQLYDEI